ncbi:hypothetical protein GF337_04675, partial [candidate division KSB1 bacterium]|nr:hypothetical protein [candidate division KSB1 bacterium]
MFHTDTGVAMILRKQIYSIFLFCLLSYFSNGYGQFSFVHMTDTHVNSRKSLENLKTTIDDIRSIDPQPDFIINTGDITEMGSIAEFESYFQLIDTTGFKFYHAMGNHDIRWANNGYKNFTSVLGKTYQSFDYKGFHFIILNSGILVEQYGHFTIEQLQWLKNDLKNIGSDKPIIMAAHHPLMGDRR